MRRWALLFPLLLLLLAGSLLGCHVARSSQAMAEGAGGGLQVRHVAHSAETLLKELQSLGGSPVFLLFLGDDLQGAGSSWCPDCRRADPIIMEHFAALQKPTILVRVYVGDRSSWRSPSNPFRAPPFALRCVPTLARWTGSGLAEGALGDSEADQEDLLQGLTASL